MIHRMADFNRIGNYIIFKLKEKFSARPVQNLKNDLIEGFEGLKEGVYEEAALNFSGGPNSVLTAALLTRYVPRIHLLAYTRSFMKYKDRMEVNLKGLVEKFGPDKFVYREMNLDRVISESILGPYEEDKKKFGAVMYMMKKCAGCKLGMHLSTIRYCIDNKISLACDGSNRSGSILIPDQNQEVITVIKSLYRKHGITYLLPVYNVYRSDWECFQMRITDKVHLKTESLFYSSQPSCGFIGLDMHLYVLGYYIPRFGLDHYIKAAVKYHEEKLPILSSYIHKMTSAFYTGH